MAEQEISQLMLGLNMDNTMSQLKPGQFTYALNSLIEGFDGNEVTIQNEEGNELCFTFPTGYKVIGAKNIIEQNRVFFILTNPETGDGEVGFGDINTCIYSTLISDVGNECKFNFNINNPIHKIIVKTTNCSTQAYFTDGLNPRRYIDFDDLPWVEIIDPNNIFKRIKIVGKLDCNKLNVQPDFSIPTISGEETTVGGSLITGVYQGIIQYANALGEGLTTFYNATNPIGIFEQKESPDFNLPTSKAITFEINNLDITGLYEYFNLVVVKTINGITTPEVVATLPISNPQYIYTYTGTTKTNKDINIEDIFLKSPYYETAQDVFEIDNVLGWGILSEEKEINFQPFWSRLNLKWETYQLPYNQFQAYNNGINLEKYRGYFRDEVYAFEGCFIFKNGKQSRSYHIPGRAATEYDLEIIDINNPDNGFSTKDPCTDPVVKFRWQVYNTGSVLNQLYPSTIDNCYIGPYEYGEFGFWESTERYPQNTTIWGNLAGQRIRHHKFPDVLISPIHDNNVLNNSSYEHSIYPIGVRIDPQEFLTYLRDTLPQSVIDQIAGFKITRGNRVNNKSVIAKGLIHNVGVSRYDEKVQLYPNYPFNDVSPDPYFVSSKMENHVGFVPEKEINGFNNEISHSHFVFHSPDTHFYQPSLDNEGEMIKLESVEYGQSRSHFVKVDDNAEYKFLTPRTINAAAGLGLASGIIIGAGTFGWPNYNMASTIPTYQATIDLFERLSPYTNFGYNFNSVGDYSNSFPIPNSGNKQRSILYNKYVVEGLNGVDNGQVLNNFRRESAVYIASNSSVIFPDQQSSTIPKDNSRYNLASIGDNLSPTTIRTRNICSYYGAIKKDLIGQWGQMYSYETIDTGYYQNLRDSNNQFITSYPIVFGGDIFINRFAYKSKMPFFRDNTVLQANQTDIAYDEVGNINYPMFWISTKASRYDIDVDQEIEDVRQEFLAPSVFNILSNLFTGGSVGATTAMALIGKLFTEIYSKIGLKNVNMDRADVSKIYEDGLMYLFAYGIPYFFCESEVNVDYRQATNQREGNFYPNVGGDIPDDWLQEKQVPIINDNQYTYNKSYSKQNKENYFAHLREDYDPNKICLTEFPNRGIWSEQSNLEETKNNWLVYKPVSRYDFPKSFGDLIALDGIENRQVVARFENKTLLYNALYTAPTSAGQVYLGKPIFDTNTPPLDYADTDLGFIGSQNKFLLKTEFGHIQVDAKRGGVFLLNGQKVEDLTRNGMSKFFLEFLPFAIQKAFPNFLIDNHFNSCGLTGVYDPKYNRFILTKIDYKPLYPEIKLENNKFYFNNEPIELTNPLYFCNNSFTISYSFKTQSWCSFHSYIPNFYIGNSNFFYSGVNSNICTAWRHNTSITSFNNFYGQLEPYIIEYPIYYKGNEEILQGIKDYSKILKYSEFQELVETDNEYFSHAIIYNNQQCSGTLKLTKKPKNNLQSHGLYPIYHPNEKEILFTKSNSFYNFNTFWSLNKSSQVPMWTKSCKSVSIYKDLNDANMNYGKRSFNKAPIMAKNTIIRLINKQYDTVKMVSQFLITENQISYK